MELPFHRYFCADSAPSGWDAVALLSRLVLGGAFVWAGVVKLIDPGLFLIQIRTFEMLPDPFAALLALGLPPLEILAGVAVILGWGFRGGLMVITGALLLFLVAIAQAWIRGLEVDCGCFGASSKESAYWSLLIRDWCFLGIAGVLWWLVLRARDSAKEES